MARIFSCYGRCAKISLEFYGQRAVFGSFVRKQNAFYGQTIIFRWFVRKFLPIMMRIYGQSRLFGAFIRKNGPKRLNFYGQTAVFDHFVRNWQWFCKMQRCTATAQSLHLTSITGKTWFLRFARNLRLQCFGKDNRVEHFSDFLRFCSTFGAARAEFGESGRQKLHILPGFCLLLEPSASILECQVDKNHTFLPVFVYFWNRAPRFWSVR